MLHAAPAREYDSHNCKGDSLCLRWPHLDRRGLGVKTAVVTGGGSGIGLAVARRLRADGLDVATIDLRPSDTDLVSPPT